MAEISQSLLAVIWEEDQISEKLNKGVLIKVFQKGRSL